MAKKKIFTIGNSLTQALTDTAVAASNYSGELHVDIIPLRKIELDPNNPRDLVLNFTDLYDGLSHDDELYNRKKNEKETLKSISNSIKEQGIINPILVYKHGDKYQLVAGERRTLASILAGKDDIPAKILTSKPNKLKLSILQWIENVEREDLSLWERIRNLEKIFTAYAEEQKKTIDQITPTEFSQVIGCSLQQGINYKNIMSAPQKLRSLIQNNQIKNIEKVALIAKAPPKMQDELITACLKGATLKELKKLTTIEIMESSLEKEKRGRLLTKVNFGVTQNINVAKIIIQSVLKNDSFSFLNAKLHRIEWTDYKSVTKAFKFLIKTLEEKA
ncbi:MAG: ParB/RepB/Spo0J family partition protein [Proteobacteria bacterium]|nr:ParB/RepB/Spo0J family partition protein [Pseudomonadota bacterium]